MVNIKYVVDEEISFAVSCGLSKLDLNVIGLSYGPSPKISCKSVQTLSRNLSDKQIRMMLRCASRRLVDISWSEVHGKSRCDV